jgi:hypothetical protein
MIGIKAPQIQLTLYDKHIHVQDSIVQMNKTSASVQDTIT